MRQITIQTPEGKKEYSLYNSIRELPIYRSKKFYAALMQDMGIGSTFEDADRHLERLLILTGAGKSKDAFEEAKNLRLNIFSALNGISFKARAIAQLFEGLSEEEALTACDYIPAGEAEEILNDVKKNLTQKGS